MAEHDILKEFVSKLSGAAGDNLLSVILYGSAADGEFHARHSDFNVLCVLREVSFNSLAQIAPVVEWWRKEKEPPPMVLTSGELQSSADVFSIEFTDIKHRYRVLYGEDLLRGLNVPMHLHRFQLEYELREKLFLLRQHLLLAGKDEGRLWDVMLRSLSSFITLFRHVLIEMGRQNFQHSREVVAELSKHLNFNASPFVQLLRVRERNHDHRDMRAERVAAQYLEVIEQVASAVDSMQSQTA